MARSSRQRAAGNWHHVMNRGARRLPIFGDDADHLGFLDRLERSVRGPQVEVHAYALMPNHFHLLVRAELDALATTMRLLGSDYTKRFNVKYGLDGALFRGRYRSVPVASDRHLAGLVRYIHRNPSPHSAPTLASFRWTSHLAYIGMAETPTWLSTTLLLRRFHGDRRRFREFVESHACELDDSETPFAMSPRILGPVDIEHALGIESEPERELLRMGGRGVRNDLRIACVFLCAEFACATTTELAGRYGFASASGLRTAVQRGRALAESDRGFAATIDAARLRLRRSA